MNDQNLANLAAGFKTVENCPVPVIVQQAPAVKTVVPVCAPKSSYAIDPSCFASQSDGVIEFTFFNGTGEDQIVKFDPLMGETGDFAFCDDEPSAVDFPAFTDGSPLVGGGNGGPLLVRTIRLIQIMPIIVSRIEMVSSSAAQSRTKLILYNNGISCDNDCQSTVKPPMCPPCPNGNNQENVFNTVWSGTFPAGMLTGFGITVKAGEEVTITLCISARAIPTFVAVAGCNDNNCNV